jgi:hypothetical protein
MDQTNDMMQKGRTVQIFGKIMGMFSVHWMEGRTGNKRTSKYSSVMFNVQHTWNSGRMKVGLFLPIKKMEILSLLHPKQQEIIYFHGIWIE